VEPVAHRSTTKSGRLSLFVFIDAFGWELVQHYPFLDDLLPVKAPLGTQFGYSSTCIPTILTGKLPREHGHFTFFTRANGKTPFAHYGLFNLIPRFITRRGRVRSYMSKCLKRVHGISGYFQIYGMPFEHLHHFDYTEKRDIFEPGGINGGCPTIFDWLRENHIPHHRSDWHVGEEENLAAAGRAIDQGDIRFAFVYLAAMDSILHNEGKYGDAVARKVEWYDAQLRQLVQRAEQRYGEVRLFVFSDHGMTPTESTVPLMDRINALGLRFGQDYLAAYDSTMARFWFNTPRRDSRKAGRRPRRIDGSAAMELAGSAKREPAGRPNVKRDIPGPASRVSGSARDAITAALNDEPLGHILSQDELTAWGCDFPQNEYGDLFYLMDPGHLLSPSFMGEKPLAGMHGYHPDHKDSVAAFMTNTQDTTTPARLDNMYALMRGEVDETAPIHGGRRDAND
jgi:Type I phosphodiesterase / nucleotide pyrophosphatase